MAHRIDSPERIHLARHVQDEFHQHQTVVAFESIRDGRYKPDRAPHRRPDGEVFARNDTARVQAALAQSLVVPLALAIACPTCGTDAGVACIDSDLVRGICGPRARAAVTRRELR